MNPSDRPDPVKVRIVGSASGQVAALACTLAILGVVIVWHRRARYFPLAATRTARKMRHWAAVIEDAGLNHARPKENTP